MVNKDQSINQSKHISIAPYVASESEAHMIMMIMTCWFKQQSFKTNVKNNLRR